MQDPFIQERKLHKEAMEAWARAYAAKNVREARRLGKLALEADKAWEIEQTRIGLVLSQPSGLAGE